MFKQFSTLFRAVQHNAAEDFTDRHALLILQQQMRDAAQAVDIARKAVAIAMAQNDQEQQQCTILRTQIKDLEARVIAALEKEKEDLAQEAAETIAVLEVDLADSEQAHSVSSTEIRRLRANVRIAETRLKDLKRGQRIATATDKTQRLREQIPNSGLSPLKDAEDTLTRLRTRQKHADATQGALEELCLGDAASKVTEKLAEAGCGPATKPNAADVLTRLRKQALKTSQS